MVFTVCKVSPRLSSISLYCTKCINLIVILCYDAKSFQVNNTIGAGEELMQGKFSYHAYHFLLCTTIILGVFVYLNLDYLNAIVIYYCATYHQIKFMDDFDDDGKPAL